MSVVGNWSVAVQTPFGEQTVVLEFSDEHAGVARYGAETIPLQGVATAGDYASWTVFLAQPVKVALDCRVELHGDAMSGTASAGFFGEFPLRGIRTE